MWRRERDCRRTISGCIALSFNDQYFRNAFPRDICGEQRPESVPPEPHRLVTDVDAALVQQVLDVAKRQREPNGHHHRQADDLRTGLEKAKRRALGHDRKLRGRPARSSWFLLTVPSSGICGVVWPRSLRRIMLWSGAATSTIGPFQEPAISPAWEVRSSPSGGSCARAAAVASASRVTAIRAVRPLCPPLDPASLEN